MAIIPTIQCQSGIFKKEPEVEKKKAIESACKTIEDLAHIGAHSIPENELPYKFCIRTTPKVEEVRWEIEIHTTIDVSDQHEMEMANSSDGEVKGRISLIREGKREIYWLTGTTAVKIIDTVIELIRPRVNGNRYSIDNLNPHSKHLPSDYWNVEKYQREHKWIYKRFIYPLVLESAKSLLQENSTILELCAGDGEMGKMLLEGNGERIQSYHLVDLNETCCRAMREKFAAQPKAKVYHEDIIEMNYEKLGNEPLDLVIGSGALTHEVLPSREGALMALTKVSQKVKEGGHLILCGLSPLWVRHEDFEERRFRVLNSGIPYKRWVGDSYLPFIIAQKM